MFWRAGRVQQALLWLAIVGGAVSLASGFVAPSTAVAQEEGAAPEGGGGGTEPGVEVQHTKNPFVWFVVTIGVIGYSLIAISVYFVAVVFKLFVELKESIACPPALIDQVNAMIEARQFREIYDLVREDDSLLAQLLTVGIVELPNGLPEAREAMERQCEAAGVELEKQISLLAVLGTLGPMIGLLGTLKGMIASFSVIALSDQQLKASQVAEGISEALLLTLLGVGLSVPAIYFYAVFRNRVAQMTVNSSLRADEFLRAFSQAAKKRPASGGTTTTTPRKT